MSNQIVISSGAKVRNLSGVLTGTSGIVNSLGINVPDGIPQLDGSGKILVSQLPNSVMEYKGTWDAATNTPTLANGTGNAGDVYLCNVAGTTDFGAGPITFAVGDQVLYSGTTWEKASGATGTVTSVAVTESGDALTITGSPITTSGTINIGFAGTGSQYIKGDGTLATFPTTIDQAKKLITEVYNSTGATLTKGTIVYINGGQGNLPTVTKAIATGDSTSAQTYGVVQSDITNNNNGFVVVIGSLTDIDTQAYLEGMQLYLSGTTAGEWTSTKPSAPIHLVYIGIVVRSHPTQGVVEIRIQNGYELEELHDVAISSVANNDGIFYNSSNDLWENKTIGEVLGYTPANASLVVPYTGATTNVNIGNNLFTSSNIRVDGDNTSNFGYLGFKQFSGGSNGFNGYTSIFAQSTNYLGFSYSQGAGSSKTALFASDLISSNTTRIYSLPNADGTIALTSDLGSYLPLSGGTLTGALSGTSATFSSNVTSNGFFYTPSNATTGALSGFVNQYAANASSRSWKITNDVSSYGDWALQQSTTQTGTTYANQLYFSPTGAATFSSSVSVATSNPGSRALSVGGEFSIGSNSSNTYELIAFINSSYARIGPTYQSGGSYVPLTFWTSDAERMRITSSGNVGIGTSSPGQKLSVAGRISFAAYETDQDEFGFWTTTGSSGGVTMSTAGATNLLFRTNSTERMRITSSGNVGIGTTNPTAKLSMVVPASASDVLALDITNAVDASFAVYLRNNITTINAGGSGNMVFSNSSERMRITSGGSLIVGATSIFASGLVCSDGGTTYTPFSARVGTTSNAGQMYFLNPNGIVGSITTSGSATAFNTSSDYRLKHDLRDFDGISLIQSIKVYDYEWKSDKIRSFGVIAHELQEIIPQAVYGEKDGKEMQGVDYSKLVPVLVKAIQEQQAQIEELKSLINK